MKHTLSSPPEREVTRVLDLVGPRGGTTHVLTLSCGHWVATRKLSAKTSVRCVGCLIEAATRRRKTTWEDISDHQLIQLGRDARGTGRKECMVRQLVPVAIGLFKEDAAEVQYARKRCARLWNDRFAR